MFWIALKLYYTARTGSGAAPASRRRAAAAKSAPAATFATRTGGGVCRVSWVFAHCPRLLRATTGIDTRRIQPLRTCNRGVAVPFWVCPRTRHAGAGTTGHLDQRPARRLSAPGVAPACLAVTPVPWRRPHPSLRSTCRVSARLGCSAGPPGQPDPKALSWHVRTRRSWVRHRLGGQQPAGRFACAMA